MVNTHGTRRDELVERGPRHERPESDIPERNESQQPRQGATASVTAPELEHDENEVSMGNVEPNDPQAELKAMIAAEVAKALQNTMPMLLDQLQGKRVDDQVVNKPEGEGSGIGGLKRIDDGKNDDRERKHGCSYKTFVGCKPMDFFGDEDPV